MPTKETVAREQESLEMARERIIHVGIEDCIVQTFRAGGKGGQHQNKKDTGVRVIHVPSGARGESREERSQLANKKNAFVRMAQSEEFQRWIKVEHAKRIGQIEAIVNEQMKPHNLIIEYGPFDC